MTRDATPGDGGAGGAGRRPRHGARRGRRATAGTDARRRPGPRCRRDAGHGDGQLPEGPGPLSGDLVFPSRTSLSVDGLDDIEVRLDDVGTFTGLPVDLPGDLPAGVVTFATGCRGEATFQVLPAPTLELCPPTAGAGADVVATGTCPRGPTAPRLFLDGRPLGPVALDDRTGEIGPTTVVVPDDAAPGGRVVTTTCGGRATLTVPLPRTTTTVPPAETLVTVPDLRGLTEAEVVSALAGQLVLADPTGAEGRVVDQDPPPGAPVRPGTAVRIELRAAGAVEPAGAYLRLSDAPRGPVPGLDVDLDIRREPARWGPSEVVGGRR